MTEEKLDREQILNIVTAIALLLLAISAIAIIIYVFTDSARCYANPILYSAKTYAKQNNIDYECRCSGSEINMQDRVCSSIEKKCWDADNKKTNFNSSWLLG